MLESSVKVSQQRDLKLCAYEELARKAFLEICAEQAVPDDVAKDAWNLSERAIEVARQQGVRFEYPALKAFLSHMVGCVVRARRGESVSDVGSAIEKEVGESLINAVFSGLEPLYRRMGAVLTRPEAVLVATHIAASRNGGKQDGQGN